MSPCLDVSTVFISIPFKCNLNANLDKWSSSSGVNCISVCLFLSLFLVFVVLTHNNLLSMFSGMEVRLFSSSTSFLPSFLFCGCRNLLGLTVLCVIMPSVSKASISMFTLFLPCSDACLDSLSFCSAFLFLFLEYSWFVIFSCFVCFVSFLCSMCSVLFSSSSSMLSSWYTYFLFGESFSVQ